MSKSKSVQRVTISTHLARTLFGSAILEWMYPKPFAYSEHTANRYLTHNDDSALSEPMFDWMKRFFKEQKITIHKEMLYPHVLFPSDVIVTGLHKDLPMHIAIDVEYYKTNPLDALKETVDFISLHRNNGRDDRSLYFYQEPGMFSNESYDKGGVTEESLIKPLIQQKTVSLGWFIQNERGIFLNEVRCALEGKRTTTLSKIVQRLKQYVNDNEMFKIEGDNVVRVTSVFRSLGCFMYDVSQETQLTLLFVKKSSFEQQHWDTEKTADFFYELTDARRLGDKFLRQLGRPVHADFDGDKLTFNEGIEYTKQLFDATLKNGLRILGMFKHIGGCKPKIKQFALIEDCVFRLTADDLMKTTEGQVFVMSKNPLVVFGDLAELRNKPHHILRGGILFKGTIDITTIAEGSTGINITDAKSVNFKAVNSLNNIQFTLPLDSNTKTLICTYIQSFNKIRTDA